MDDKDYEILLALSQEKSISKAAEKLFITQPALSKRIQKIEKELDIQLLCRTSKGVLLTPLGEGIIPYVQTISSQNTLIHNYISANRTEVGGSLIAGISQNYSRYTLPNVLKKFSDNYPDVSVTIRTGKSNHMYSLLQNGIVNLAIVRGEYKWEDGQIFLSSEPLCLVTSEKYKTAPLSSYPYIGRYSDSSLQDQIDLWLEENQLTGTKKKLQIDNIDTILEMIEIGCGWSILPSICLKQFSGIVEPLYFQDGTPFLRNTYLLYHKNSMILPQLKFFIQSIIKEEHPGC